MLLEPIFKEFFSSFAHLSHAILSEICIYKIMAQHTSDSYGRGYVSFTYYLLYFCKQTVKVRLCELAG